MPRLPDRPSSLDSHCGRFPCSPCCRRCCIQVLIFSQFKIMLDIIEDFLRLEAYPYERVDGSVTGTARQAAIDRFQGGQADSFVFLLSTKAGGQGITLTAADTAIIYDRRERDRFPCLICRGAASCPPFAAGLRPSSSHSPNSACALVPCLSPLPPLFLCRSDWNPQNDLQAMARCHRIGQDKDVKVYRLLSRSTYEEQLFQTASRKSGLEEALLGNIAAAGGTGDDNPETDAQRITELLKFGVHK